MAENSGGAAKRRRGPGRPFQPGQSGNPGGRRPMTQEHRDALAAVRALAPDAAEVLRVLMADPATPPGVKLRAVSEVLDRTYGKADQALIVEDKGRDVVNDIRAEVERIRAEVTGRD